MEELRLLNVVIPARRYAETLAFYRDVLGLSVLHEGAAHCFMRAGGVQVAIHPVDEWGSHSGGGIYLDFCVASRDTAEERLRHAGVPIEQAWDDKNGRFLKLKDPEGNTLELIELP